MKKLLFIIMLSLVTLTTHQAEARIVNGYQRGDGTYVAPHYRSPADGNPYNNYRQP